MALRITCISLDLVRCRWTMFLFTVGRFRSHNHVFQLQFVPTKYLQVRVANADYVCLILCIFFFPEKSGML